MKRFVYPLLAVVLALQLSATAQAQSKYRFRQWPSTGKYQRDYRAPQYQPYQPEYQLPPYQSKYHGTQYPQYPSVEQPRFGGQSQYAVPQLARAIASGAPFVIRLHPGEFNGTLIGGETYYGHYNPDSNTFTVSGPGIRPEDGQVIPVTATYGGANPMWGELSVWGAGYTFDPRGNLFVATSGRLAGTVSLRQ
jgi:hypothetical protein